MKQSMKKFNKHRIISFCSHVVSFLIIVQPCFPVLAFSRTSEDHFTLRTSHENYSEIQVLCLEDVEDKNIDKSQLCFNVFSFSDSKIFLTITNPLNDYIHNLNHSRSPPITYPTSF